MSRNYWTGVVLIVGAAVVGAVIAFGLYQWETDKRASEAHLFPTATALPAGATPTATLAGAQATGAATTNAAPSNAGAHGSGDVAAGSKVYTAKCNVCHPGGKAGMGPAVSGPQFSAKYPDEAALTKVIRGGQAAMPPFPASTLPDSDLSDLLAYMHSLP